MFLLYLIQYIFCENNSENHLLTMLFLLQSSKEFNKLTNAITTRPLYKTISPSSFPLALIRNDNFLNVFFSSLWSWRFFLFIRLFTIVFRVKKKLSKYKLLAFTLSVNGVKRRGGLGKWGVEPKKNSKWAKKKKKKIFKKSIKIRIIWRIAVIWRTVNSTFYILKIW